LGGTSPQGLVNSFSNHNTEVRAKKWVEVLPELGPIEIWNWQETTAVSSKLNRFIRTKLASYKLGSRPVLPDAAAAFAAGMAPICVRDQKFLEDRNRQRV
jgi:hypothetical protein